MGKFAGILFIVLFVFACKSDSKSSDKAQINENVHAYFFLSDSVDVSVAITDTLFTEDLEELISSVEKNLNLVNMDLDTLSLMIDEVVYQKMEHEKILENGVIIGKNKYRDSIQQADFMLLNYQLKQAQLAAKRNSFKQTKRILLHLQRSVWANIAGYNIVVDYMAENAPVHVDLLLDANLNIVD